MTKTLIDPTKGEFALLEIIETYEGRRHQRNDGNLFKLAEENPWYILATVFGEPEAFGIFASEADKEIDTKNRRAWNGWFGEHLSPEKRAEVATQMGLTAEELEPLSADEKSKVMKILNKRFKPLKGVSIDDIAPQEPTNFTNTAFLKPLGFEKRYFSNEAYFHHSHFASSTIVTVDIGKLKISPKQAHLIFFLSRTLPSNDCLTLETQPPQIIPSIRYFLIIFFCKNKVSDNLSHYTILIILYIILTFD